MTRTPRVSVIMPFLDPPEAFFQEAVDSVLSQSFQDWELILVDDGSGRTSGGIARTYAGQDPRIRLLDHSGRANRGASASRNLGLANARGEYVAFLDADDVWLPDKLERQVPILDLWPDAALTYWNTLYWYSWTGDPADRDRDRVRPLGAPLDRMLHPPELLERYLTGRAAIPCMCSLLARRSAIEAVGGFEESFTHLFTDQSFYAKMILAHLVVVTAGWKEKYRRHADSSTVTADRTGTVHAAYCQYIEWLAEYLSHHGWEGTRLSRLVRRRLWTARHRRIEAVSNTAWHARRRIVRRTRGVAGRVLGKEEARRLRARVVDRTPAIGGVRFGHLRRLAPISRRFGFDRGGPIDRYYIESFLDRHREDVRGHVLEFGDDAYTRRFGDGRVVVSDVLHVHEGNPAATYVADLAKADNVPSDAFDCILCTQTLQLVFDVGAAVDTLYRILKPGGVALVTIPGITQVSGDEWGTSWYWRFTPLSARRLFERVFPTGRVELGVHGNVLAAIAFLQGLSAAELEPEELDFLDPCYDVLITVRATKPPA
jgi:glycosyltransferase involved in cell wall biosynthesis